MLKELVATGPGAQNGLPIARKAVPARALFVLCDADFPGLISQNAVSGESHNAPPEMPTKRFDCCKYLSAKPQLRQRSNAVNGRESGGLQLMARF
jgi:hypothetical protein